MEVSVVVHKIIKFAIYSIFSLWVEVLMKCGEVVLNRKNNQGCQFDVHFIQCQQSINISEIVNEFVQCVQNYFNMYAYPFSP